MLTETVAALKTQAVLNKVVASLEAEVTLTENVAVLEHVETLNTMRPDDHLRRRSGVQRRHHPNKKTATTSCVPVSLTELKIVRRSTPQLELPAERLLTRRTSPYRSVPFGLCQNKLFRKTASKSFNKINRPVEKSPR